MTRRRIFLLAGIGALLLGVAALYQWRSAEADGSGAYRRGIAALEKGDARTARVELMNAIKAAPQSAAARVAQGQALVELGDGAGAQADIERARKLGATPSETRHLMAEALLLQGDNDGALKEADAADAAPAFAGQTARIAGRAYMAQGNMRGALGAFDKAMKIAPQNGDNWVDLSRYRLAVGDQAGAVAAADRAVRLAPADIKALTLRAELTRDQYGLAAALPWFEQALKANPDYVPALIEYAATLADIGQAGLMLSVTRRILSLDPGNPRAYFMQAVMAARAGRDDLARALLAKTDGQLDDVPAVLLLRGVLHMESGNAVLAADAFGALVQAQPDNRQARILLGRAQYEMGDLASAAGSLAPAVAQADADPYVLTLAARVQERLGNRTLADDMLARAAWPSRRAAAVFAGDMAGQPAQVGTAGDNIPYIRSLLNAGQTDAAVDRAASLTNANPGAPAAHVVLGDALDAAGRYGDAARSYEAAANIRFSQEVALRLAAAWQRAGDAARAAQVVGLFLGQNPANIEAQRLAAAFSMQAHDWRNALRLLQAIRARVGDNDAMLMADLARASLESGDIRQGRAFAANAYRLMPGNPMTADIYGWALLRAGVKGSAATDLLEKAVALAPAHPVFQMHLGQAYAANGRKGEAYAALSRAAAVKGFADRQQALDALADL